MTQAKSRAGPCAGIRVLELGTSMISGPFCGQMLGDMGADVVKLEGPEGDVMRQVYPLRDGQSAQFHQFNRNKRSIAVDLKSPDGIATAQALIRRSDVLIENMRPGVTRRLALDYDAARAINPRLVYVSINGFGAEGPYAKLPAYDQVVQALTGFAPIQGSADAPEPIRSVIVDKVTSLAATSATLAALLQRAQTGQGQHVEVRMLDAFASIMLPEILASRAFVGEAPAPLPSQGIYRPLKTADGHLLGLIAQPHQFAAFCTALGREELLDDPRFATVGARFSAMGALIDALEETTRTRTTADLIALLWRDANIAIAPVNTIDQFLVDPQVAHNDTVFVLPDGAGGEVRHLAPFAVLSGCDPACFTAAPQLDAHGDEIRAELAADRAARS
jgi:crotonobetainyl-CoA:carnitine CoA-transferase CaiB-like acyl-CoA transferase